MKKIIILTTAILFIFATYNAKVYFTKMNEYQNIVKNINLESIDLNSTEDGIYYGEFNANFIESKVEVVIENKKIVEITILDHHNNRGVDAEAITASVIKEQTIDVDTISGATNSSYVILKAIENALVANK